MADIQHKNITEIDLHEPKGVSVATVGKVYVADGSGSGDWNITNPVGSFYYEDIGTGTTFTTPTAYTLMNTIGTTGESSLFTNNALGRLTYTGTDTIRAVIQADITFKHSVGTGQDIFFRHYKNGVAGVPQNVITADSGNYQHISMNFDVSLATNDYLELYLKTASGNVTVHQNYMLVVGMRV